MRANELFQTDHEDEKEAYRLFCEKASRDIKPEGVNQVYKVVHVLVFEKDKTKPIHRFFAEKMGNRYTP